MVFLKSWFPSRWGTNFCLMYIIMSPAPILKKKSCNFPYCADLTIRIDLLAWGRLVTDLKEKRRRNFAKPEQLNNLQVSLMWMQNYNSGFISNKYEERWQQIFHSHQRLWHLSLLQWTGKKEKKRLKLYSQWRPVTMPFRSVCKQWNKRRCAFVPPSQQNY